MADGRRRRPLAPGRGVPQEPDERGRRHDRRDGRAGRPDSAIAVLADAEVILPLEGLIDKEAELAKLRKTLADLERQLGPLQAKLGNEAFVSRAPAEVVEAQRAKLAELEAQRAAVAALLDKDGPG